MTGAGGTGGGFAPFSMGMVTRLDLRERVPQAEDLIELVVQGLSPEKAVTKALEQDFPEFDGGSISDNTVELNLTPLDVDKVLAEIQSKADHLGIEFKLQERGQVYVRSDNPGSLQKLVQELRDSGFTFQVSEVRTETRS